MSYYGKSSKGRGKARLELLFIVMISVSTLFHWKDYRKKMTKAETEEEIRKAFVPFFLTGSVLKYKKQNREANGHQVHIRTGCPFLLL